MTDNGVGTVFIFCQEILGAREGNLIDIFVNILGCHTDAVITDGKRAGLFIDFDIHTCVAHLTLEIAERCKSIQLLGGVDCVRHQLAQKDFVVAVKKFLDDGENVLGGYTDSAVSFCHYNNVLLDSGL